MKILLISLLLLILLACSTQKVSRFSSLTDSELSSISDRVLKEGYVKYCERLLPIAKEIYQRDPLNNLKLASQHYAEYRCAVREVRWKDAYTSMIQAEKHIELSNRLLALKVSHKANKVDDAVARLEVLASDRESTDVLKVKPSEFWSLYCKRCFKDREDLKKRRISAMAYSPHFNHFEAEFRTALAINRLYYDAEEGDFSDSDKWLSEILEPMSYLRMLVDKRFESIWPKLEKKVGPNFKSITNSYLEAMTASYKNDMSDRHSRAFALLYNGKYEELVEFVKLPKNSDYSKVTLDEAWALNAKIYALDILARHEEAEDIFDRLATIPISFRNRNWRINFAINRAERLFRYEKWQRSYDAAVYAENFNGSPYSKMLILDIKVCSLIKLGKESLVVLLLDELFKNRKDSYISVASAMLCSNKDQLAEKVLIEALEDEKRRGVVLSELQSPQFSFYPGQEKASPLNSYIRSNSLLNKSFENKGRFLPNKFIPHTGLSYVKK